MKINTKNYVSVFVASIFLLGGCAEDFKQVSTPSGSTITQIASGSNDFNLLTAALVKTGLASSLDNNNSGAFTVFAPTDAAFIAYFQSLSLPSATADEAAILNWINSTLSPSTTPSLATVAGILAYHVVSSKIPSAEVIGAKSFVTVGGTARLSLSKVGANIVLNANRTGFAAGNGAQSVSLDTEASNGVIHTIDKVLNPVTSANIWIASLLNFSVNYSVSPPAVTVYGTLLKRTPPVAPSTTPGSFNLTDASAQAPVDAVATNYNLFSMALAKAELATLIIPIATPFPDYTVFAPTDLAMRNFLGAADEAQARNAINNLSVTDLANLIRYHVVPGRFVSLDLTNGPITTALAGKTFTVTGITITDGKQGTSTITSLNNLTNAGVLHQISKVLEPN